MPAVGRSLLHGVHEVVATNQTITVVAGLTMSGPDPRMASDAQQDKTRPGAGQGYGPSYVKPRSRDHYASARAPRLSRDSIIWATTRAA
jgi:hypothetical protein